MLHSPDAVDSRSMLSASAHPSHVPHVPHASSRTTESTLASRPRSSGKLIFGRDDRVQTPALCITDAADAGATGPPPECFRTGRTPAAARTSTIGAWPDVLCIRCAYVQLSLVRVSGSKKRQEIYKDRTYPGPSTNSPPSCAASPPRSHTGIPTRSACATTIASPLIAPCRTYDPVVLPSVAGRALVAPDGTWPMPSARYSAWPGDVST